MAGMSNNRYAYSTPCGDIILTFAEAGRLRRLRFATESDSTNALLPLAGSHPALSRQLDQYFTGEPTAFDVALDLDGTPFQQRVWSELLRIPFGETRTYADIARALGVPGGSRAVGGANGRNPVAIIVPCHRVVAADGLGGYTGGLRYKRALLALEGVLTQLPLMDRD